MNKIKISDLKKEFGRMQLLLTDLKSSSTAKTVQTVFSKGPYFDFPAYSYQRNRMQQGRLIKNINKVKNHNDVYHYKFDHSGKLVCAGWGNRLGQFTRIFYLYDKRDFLFLSYAYDEHDCPANVTLYNFSSERMTSSKSYGLYGVREEQYFYDDSLPSKVNIYTYSHDNENEKSQTSEYFHYDNEGRLQSIELVYGEGNSEIIYEKRL